MTAKPIHSKIKQSTSVHPQAIDAAQLPSPTKQANVSDDDLREDFWAASSYCGCACAKVCSPSVADVPHDDGDSGPDVAHAAGTGG